MAERKERSRAWNQIRGQREELAGPTGDGKDVARLELWMRWEASGRF